MSVTTMVSEICSLWSTFDAMRMDEERILWPESMSQLSQAFFEIS